MGILSNFMNCDRTDYQKAKVKCDNRKIQEGPDWIYGNKLAEVTVKFE